MSKVVIIWLDGFSSTYLNPEKTPFISEMARSGFSANLESLFAFAGIGVSAFTGTSVNTHKIWCDYVHKEGEEGISPTLKRLLGLCDHIPHDVLNPYARYITCKLLGYNPGTPNIIPLNIIDSFEIKECRSLTSENPIKGIPTLFDQLRKHGVPYFLAGFHESIFEGRMTKRALRALTKDYRLILFRMASPDRLGHRYGPESDEVGRRLAEIDASVKELVMWGIQVNPSTHFIILSDHGMTPVKGSIDLLSVLKRLPPEMPRDYVVFLNSTVASLWFNSGEARAAVKTELEKIEQGMILDKAKLKELEIDGIGSEYGELLFALKEGQVFFPDFYRRRKIPKGMHGYAFAKHDKPPFIIYSPGALYKPKRDATARFIDVMPTILGLLDLPVLTTCEGRNLLKSRNQ